MQNEILWITLLAVSFLGVIISYKLFGKIGLYIWTAMAVIIANIQVTKIVEFSVVSNILNIPVVTALGNIVYSSIFLSTDILCENHKKEDAKKAIWIGFFVLISVTILMQICLAFIPDASDTQSEHIAAIFGLFLPILIASISAYLISQLFDVWWYNKLKQMTQGKHLWLRNNISTLVSQLIDNVLFTGIFFVGYFLIFNPEGFLGWPIILSIFVTSYIMKFIVAALDTPFLYLAKKIRSDK
jgi:queuosine precursor transporter